MLKSILLASAVMISAPVLAQEAPAQETSPAAAEQPAGPAEAPAAVEQPAETAQQPQEATPAEPAAPTEQAAQTAEQQPGPAPQGQQPANATQIAAVVDQGFPTYDKDADGNLKAEEFGSWMVALRSASEPAFKGDTPADKQWLTVALAQADTDKSGGVNKDELKSFLTPAAAAS